MKIKLTDIRIDGGTQPRAAINNEAVAEYAESIQAGDKFPPLEVVFDGAAYWLWDGFHRYHAAMQAGLDIFDANVTPGTLDQARWRSLATNKAHGLRRTNEDKRKAASTALELHPEMSDHAIAHHCGVSHTFVGKLRQELPPPPAMTCNDTTKSDVSFDMPCNDMKRDDNLAESPSNRFQVNMTGNDTEGQKRVGLDGKTYNIENLTDRSRHIMTGGDFPPPPDCPPPAGNVPPPVPEPPAPVIRDAVGQSIPERCLALWNRRAEVQALLTAISNIRGKLVRAQEDKDEMYTNAIIISSVMAELDTAYRELKSAQPYAVCTYCHGEGDCRACKGLGMLSKFKWDTAVPKEHKAYVAENVRKETGQ
ncbi:MAG: ParB/RepB/Spo0J family partition protein [Victivallaceae bacterium]|nr:ParB/RepB/Spo0J family partition protein [Victivallaceae bacterium]